MKHPVLHMWLTHRTEEALLVSSSPISKARTWWIPRSLVNRMAVTAPPDTSPLNFSSITFTLPEWKIEQEGLWEFVP